MERIDRLWPSGPHYVYGDGAFLPSTDSFLLADFARIKRHDRVCDLGAGMGLLGLLLWAHEPAITLSAVELQESACALCRRNYEENGVTGTVLHADLRERLLHAGSFDLVVCNPPYFTAQSGAVAAAARGEQRSERCASLSDVCAAAAYLLPTSGRFCLVYRPERLCDLLTQTRCAGLEPKRLRFVQSGAEKPPSLVLLECRRGGHAGLTVEAPLLLDHDEHLRRAYFKDKE